MNARQKILNRLHDLNGKPATVCEIGRPLGYADNTTAKELKLLRTEDGLPVMRSAVKGKSYKVYWLGSHYNTPIIKPPVIEQKKMPSWVMFSEICPLCAKSFYTKNGQCNICGGQR